MNEFDVIVIGAGTWGSSVSLALSKRGHKVLALDEFHPPHKQGSHGGATRLARQSNSSGKDYIKLTERAWEMWADISQEANTDILVTTGSAFIGEPGSEWFDKTLSNLQLSDFDYEVLNHEESASRFPWVKTRPEELTVWEPNGAIILVEPVIRSLQNLATQYGTTFQFNEKVVQWESSDDHVKVTTSKDIYTAKKLVITAGARSSKVLQTDLPVEVERQVLVNFAVPQDHAALPALFFAAPPGDPGMPAYGCPEPDGTYKFSVATRMDIIDPDSLTQEMSEKDLARVKDVVEERLPQLNGDPSGFAVCMWSESSDGHWFLGKHPEFSNVVIGAGCTGRGFRYAPVVGAALADSVDGIDRPDLTTFSTNRIQFDHVGGA